MADTAEQKAADENLTAAIERALAAHSIEGEPYVLAEYIVITCQHRFDEDGDGITAVGYLSRDGDVPLHRSLGLAEYAAARLRKRICED